MEHYRLYRILNVSTISRFVARKWIQVNDLLNRQYSDDHVKSKTPILRLDLFNYSDTCIVVKVTITVTGINVTIRSNKELALNKNVPFRSCILKIDDKFMENVYDLSTVMVIFTVTITICNQKA